MWHKNVLTKTERFPFVNISFRYFISFIIVIIIFINIIIVIFIIIIIILMRFNLMDIHFTLPV